MVQKTYTALGPDQAAIRAFDGLSPFVEQLLALQGECQRFDAEDMAIGIALDALETAAYHFTRRRDYYHSLREARAGVAYSGNGRLKDRQEAIAAFEALRPYAKALQHLQDGCRPMGRDYLALQIARHGLETAAYHFTRVGQFYASRNDSCGPVRPAAGLGQGI